MNRLFVYKPAKLVLYMRTGAVDSPLHGGRCPPWLFGRMQHLAKAVSKAIVDEYGTGEFLRRLSDPMFFQSLVCVSGMDWHSSGGTTTLTAAIKLALAELDMGVAACGGKGKTSMKSPGEVEKHCDSFSLSEAKRKALLEATRLSAKIDSSCIQDGYSLYHHSFFMDEKGSWSVVQQGMNNGNGYARRYHWLETGNFVDGPPESIAGAEAGEVLNLVSGSTGEMRENSLGLVQDNPSRLKKYFTGQTTLFDCEIKKMPERHGILKCDMSKKDWRILEQAYELQPENYKELVCLRGMGGKKLRALALVSRLIYGSGLDWKDPVKYSFAHGGKDGFPFPVNRKDYDHTIDFLKNVLKNSGIEKKEKRNALKRLGNLS